MQHAHLRFQAGARAMRLQQLSHSIPRGYICCGYPIPRILDYAEKIRCSSQTTY